MQNTVIRAAETATPMLSSRQLRNLLDDLVQAQTTGRPIEDTAFAKLKSAAIHWSIVEGHAGPIVRLGKILRCAKGISAQRKFLATARGRLKARKLELVYADVLADAEAPKLALSVLQPFLDGGDAEPLLLVKAAKLQCKISGWTEAIALFRRINECKPRALVGLRADYILALVAVGQNAEALDIAAIALNDPEADFELLLACYRAHLASPVSEMILAGVRSRAVAMANAHNAPSTWWYKLFRAEKKFDEAIESLTETMDRTKASPKLLKERAMLAVRSGKWGRYAAQIRAARDHAPFGSPLATKIDIVESFFSQYASQTDGNPQQLESLRVPETVFEQVFGSEQKERCAHHEIQLVMIASSLGPGGAERIVAALAGHLSKRSVPSLKLYLTHMDTASRGDFYLAMADLDPSRVVFLDRKCEVKKPLCFLPIGHAETTQAIVNQLRIDRPKRIYAVLEPLTVYGALAGLMTGVHQVILHSHNMPPAILHPRSEFSAQLRECYRIVLKHKGISLLTCAEAAAASYAEWLGSEVAPKISCIHNGLDFDNCNIADQLTRTSLRAEIGLSPEYFVVGTAFSFREEKQPLLWVDAAEHVLKEHSGSRFVMFGDGKLWDATKAYIAGKGLSDYFVLPGLVSDLYRRLPLLDLFMLSSRSEALPNVLVEAQAVGVPVVAFDVGGIRETVITEKTGFLTQSASATSLGDLVLRAVRDPDWMRNAATMAPSFVRSKFAMERMLQSIDDLVTAAA